MTVSSLAADDQGRRRDQRDDAAKIHIPQGGEAPGKPARRGGEYYGAEFVDDRVRRGQHRGGKPVAHEAVGDVLHIARSQHRADLVAERQLGG